MTGWFLSSKFGRYLAAAGLTLMVLGVALLKAFTAGQKYERLKQTQATLNNVRKKIAVDEEIGRLSPAARRERLREWARE